MGLINDAAQELDNRLNEDPPDSPDTDRDAEVARRAGPQSSGETAHLERAASVMVDGEEIEVESPETKQTSGEDEGSWLGSSGEYGVPRGMKALEHRQIVQTSAMQSIVNGIVDQVLGGELVFESDDEAMEEMSDAEQQAASQLKDILNQVLTGPHLQNEALADLMTAAVEDMLGPGNAYWQLLSGEDSNLPVVALTNLDPLTIRHNVNQHGVPQTPPYWQAQNAFGGGSMASMGAIDPVPLERSDLAVMTYPKGHRSYQFYPASPAWQVREWLEILANSTTHHNRFYADNEIPPGLLQVVNASETTITDMKEKIEQASGDPRDVPIVGGEGGAQWLEMGGTAVSLDIIQEQEWFFQLCLGSLGLGKAEIGMIEDVNRANGEIESSRIYKRITGPFLEQFENAFQHIARQFDVYNELGEPFKPKLRHSDPREERAREQRLREMYQAGGITLREYVRRRGDEDLAEDDSRFNVELGGEVIDYGDHPRWVAKAMIQNAGEGVDVGDEEQPDEVEQMDDDE